jgi:hypothetical protein
MLRLVAAMENMPNEGGQFKCDDADGVEKLTAMHSSLSDGWIYLGAQQRVAMKSHCEARRQGHRVLL